MKMRLVPSGSALARLGPLKPVLKRPIGPRSLCWSGNCLGLGRFISDGHLMFDGQQVKTEGLARLATSIHAVWRDRPQVIAEKRWEECLRGAKFPAGVIGSLDRIAGTDSPGVLLRDRRGRVTIVNERLFRLMRTIANPDAYRIGKDYGIPVVVALRKDKPVAMLAALRATYYLAPAYDAVREADGLWLVARTPKEKE